MKLLIPAVLTVFMTATVAEASLVGQALKSAGRHLAGESAEAAAKQAARQAAKQGAILASREAAEAGAKRAALEAAERFGKTAAAPQFMEDLAKGTASLTARNERRLMMMAPQLAQSGQAAMVVTRLSQSGGDEMIEMLWRNRGKLASGAAVAALVLHGDDLALAGGQYIAKPVIDGAIEHVVAPVSWLVSWMAVLLGAAGIGAGAVLLRGGPAAERLKGMGAGGWRLWQLWRQSRK